MSNKTQSDRMFETLRGDILACRILPGSKLRINDIAETSEVSLGAVREALSRLGAEGLVIAESQKGYRVAPLSVEDLRDLTEARVEIEQIALARSIAHGDLDWETNLVAAWHRLSRISERVEDDPPPVGSMGDRARRHFMKRWSKLVVRQSFSRSAPNSISRRNVIDAIPAWWTATATCPLSTSGSLMRPLRETAPQPRTRSPITCGLPQKSSRRSLKIEELRDEWKRRRAD